MARGSTSVGLSRTLASADAKGNWIDAVYLREIGNPDADPVKLGTYTFAGDVQSGTTYARRELLTLPKHIQGAFQIEVLTNVGPYGGFHSALLYEHGQTDNNTLLDDQAIVVSLTPRPDLQVQSITAPDSVPAGGTGSFEFVVINQGTVPANGRWQDRVYLSVDNVHSSDDFLLGTYDNGSALLPGETYRTETAAFPSPSVSRVKCS